MDGELSDHSKEIARGTFWSLLGSGSFYLISFIYTLIVARVVTQGDYGLFLLAMGIVAPLALLGDFGFSNSLARYVPFFGAKNEPQKVRALLDSARAVVFALATLTVMGVWISADWIGGLYRNPALPGILRLLSIHIILSNLFNVHMSFLRGRMHIRKLQLCSILQNTLKLLLTLLLFYLYGPSPVSLAAAYVVSFAPSLLLALAFVSGDARKAAGGMPPAGARAVLRETVPYGLMVALMLFAGSAVTSSTLLILGYLAPADEATEIVAIYSVAAMLAGMLYVLPAAIGSIFFPLMSRLYGKGDLPRMRAVAETAQRWSLFIAMPAALVLAAYSSDILAALYGEPYRAGGLVMSIITLGIMFKVTSSVLDQTLTAMQLLSLQFRILAVSGAATVALNLSLVPSLGMTGSAIALVAGSIISAALSIHQSWKRFSFRVPPGVLKIWGAGLAALALMLAFGPFFSPVYAYAKAHIPDGDELLVKAAYLGYLSALASLSLAFFACSALLLKCFRNEDVTILGKAMRKVRLPEYLVSPALAIVSMGTEQPPSHAQGDGGGAA